MNTFSAHVATSEQLTTPSSCQAALSDLLHAIDDHDGPIALHDIEHALFALRRAIDANGITAGPELEAETIAFFVRPATERNSAWGGYFGQAWQEPTLARVSKDTLEYWKERSQSAHHPVLRARYADLLWDLPKSAKIDAVKPDHESARLAIDAYLEAVDADRFDHALNACAGALRALELASSLGDSERISRSRDAILRLDREHATDESIGLWVAFDNLVEPPNKRTGLSVEDRDRLVAEMESRLQRFSTAPASRYHPSGAEASAVRLASFYRRLDRAEDVRRVMLRYADTVRGMKGHAEPLVVSHCLEALYLQLKSFNLNREADDLNEDIRLAGEESLKDMKTISVEVPAPTKAELDLYFTQMLAGDSDQVLARIAMHFLPKRSAVEQQVRELANAAPMLSMVSHSKMNHEGRTVAHVGSLDDDLEGNIVSQVGDNMRLGADWLRETFRRGVESGVITAPVLLEFLLASPLYDDRRRPILENGLTAFMRGDSVAAVHVLLPQVEAAMRNVAVLLSAPTFAKRRGGGYHARLLDEFLRDELVANALGEDVMTYFRALLSDQRGWNIRNDICHGLAPIGMMTQAIADRVLHALLVLGCYHTSSADEAEEPSADSERPD